MSAPITPGPAADAAPEYEFTPDQERLIADLAGKMQTVGVAMLLVGVAGVAWMVYSWARGYRFVELSSLVLLVVGGWTVPAARAFARAARTHGRDISHLLAALDDLRRLFRLLHAALVAAVFLLALLFVFQRAAG